MNKRGLLIAFEGIDGTGKTTHAGLLAEWFRSIGREVVLSHEPTDSVWGRRIRESAATGRLSATEELDLFLKDRREHVEQLITPSLAAGKVVILDRYYFSTIAYQGSRGFDPVEIRASNEAFAPCPDLLLILDLDVHKALERIDARGDTANEFEKQDALTRCREIFLSLKDEPFVHVVATDEGPEKVQDCIREIAVTHAGATA